MIHLHVHTDGSLLDGMVLLNEKLINHLKQNNMNALAITDHGSMIKTYQFYKLMKDNNIKPIIGCEFYIQDEDNSTKHNHIICLAKNNVGLKNLFALSYKAVKNFYYKPRITFEALIEHKEGLIVTTACIGSKFGDLYLNNKEKLVDYVLKFKNIFHDDFYIELQAITHPSQEKYNINMLNIAKNYNIKTIVTTDAHYIAKDDKETHQVMLCIQTQSKIDNPKLVFQGEGYYLQTEEEIINTLNYIDKNDVLKMIQNTHEIADKCNVEFETGNFLPQYCENEFRKLCEIVNEHFKIRKSKRQIKGTKDEIDRITFELNVIKEKGYAGYFLIVYDFINYARQNNIPVGKGRGSAAGSMVAYIIGITDVNPMKYGLLFERFLNPERITHPDVDTDFCYLRRNEVFEYLKNKYGEQNVAHIMTESKLSAKVVVRRVLSVYGFSSHEINKIAELIPDELGITIDEAVKESPELMLFFNKNPKIYEHVKKLENSLGAIGSHAAGVVIANKPIHHILPVMKMSNNEGIQTQFNKVQVEELGCYKFDLLGLKTLTIIDKTLKLIEQNRGIKIDLDDIDLNDKTIYEQLNSLELAGIFQFDKPAGKQIIKDIKPQCFEDLIACEALCRPGVKERDLYIKNKAQGYEKHSIPVVNEILDETYGTIVYQEQTMLLMNKIAGWTLGKADKMRKVKDLNEYKEDFIQGAIKNGYTEEQALSIFNRFDLSYSFNKSHATSYAVISAHCAYLKYHYKTEFMTALMSIDNNEEERKNYIYECKQNNIQIITPKINLSKNEYIIQNNSIIMPFNAIKGIGDKACETIVKYQPYTSFNDFIEKTKQEKSINKKVIDLLIRAGCFEENIQQLLLNFRTENNYNLDKQIPTTNIDFIKNEKELFGISISSSALSKYNAPDFSELNDGQVTTLGIISEVIKHKDRTGKQMCFLKIDCKKTTYNAIVFNRVYTKFKNVIQEDNVVWIQGTKEDNTIIVDKIGLLK